MAARTEVTAGYAREHKKCSKKDRGCLLDEVAASEKHA